MLQNEKGMNEMKKRGYLAIALIGISLVFSGCKKSDNSNESSDVIRFDDYSQYKEIQTSDYVTIGEYKGLKISKDTIQVSDTEIDGKLSSVLYNEGYYVDANDSPVSSGKKVKISVLGKVDGKDNDGFTSDGYEFVYGLEQHIMDGFVQQLEGAYQGDVLNFDIVIPDTFSEIALVGKTASFTVTIDNVQSYFIPTLSEELVQEISDYETIDEYKESLIPVIVDEKLTSIKNNKKAGVWQIVSDASTVNSYPEGVLEAKEAKVRENLEVYAMVAGMELEDYVQKSYGVTFDEYLKLVVKQDLLLDAIGRAENITLSQKEYEENLKTYATNYGYNDVDLMIKKIGEDTVKEALLWDKVMEFVSEQVVID
jgi:trigger factor